RLALGTDRSHRRALEVAGDELRAWPDVDRLGAGEPSGLRTRTLGDEHIVGRSERNVGAAEIAHFLVAGGDRIAGLVGLGGKWLTVGADRRPAVGTDLLQPFLDFLNRHAAFPALAGG